MLVLQSVPLTSPLLWVPLLLLCLVCWAALPNGRRVLVPSRWSTMPSAAWLAGAPKRLPAKQNGPASSSTNGDPPGITKTSSLLKNRVIGSGGISVNGKVKNGDTNGQTNKLPVKNVNGSNGATDKNQPVPRVVGAEMKDTTRPASSGRLFSPLPSEIVRNGGSFSAKTELTRSSSSEGVLERKFVQANGKRIPTYGARINSNQSSARNGKTELKRCLSSEGVLERKGKVGSGVRNSPFSSRNGSKSSLENIVDSCKTSKHAPRGPVQKEIDSSRCVQSSRVMRTSTKGISVSKESMSQCFSGTKSTIQVPGNEGDGIQPEIPPLPSMADISDSSDNLSTIIAVDFMSNPDNRSASPSSSSIFSLNDTIQVVTESSDQPLSSTIIAVNYGTDGDGHEAQPPLPPRTKYFNGKSSVWDKLQTGPRSQAAANIAVNINIQQGSEQCECPPPIPPLPPALMAKHFGTQNFELPPVLPPRNGRLRSQQHPEPHGVPGKTSKIPTRRPSPTSLRTVDCHSSLDEGEIRSDRDDWEALFQKYEALEKECDAATLSENVKEQVSPNLTEISEDEMRSVSSGDIVDCLYLSPTSTEESKCCGSENVSGKDVVDNSAHRCNTTPVKLWKVVSKEPLNNLHVSEKEVSKEIVDVQKAVEKSFMSVEEVRKISKFSMNIRNFAFKFEPQEEVTDKVKLADTSSKRESLLKERGEQCLKSKYFEEQVHKDTNVARGRPPNLLHHLRNTTSEEMEDVSQYGKIHLYHSGGYWTGSLPRPRHVRRVVSVGESVGLRSLEMADREQVQTGSTGNTARRNSDGDRLPGGGFGVVRANTGRQLSESRFRTELEIFFRSGVLAQLESQRDERLTDHVVRLQARCRGYLARRRLTKLKIQDLAVRCIQRNVRKFLSVRDWPWWRLLVRVTPLLNVHRTEEELRLKTEELEMLRAKVEKLELERTHLKHDSDKLEARLSEMTADLAEEHSTATLATERLEVETSERLRLEKDFQEVQHQNKNLHQASERLEMELLYMRAADVNGLGSEDDDEADGDANGGMYRQRYERAVRELEFTRRRLQQQHEDDLEQLVGLKKQLEKKLSDAYEEVEEQRQVVGQWKRKVQKLNAETNDLRLLLEEQGSRNNLLEKKQRKFDSELQLLQDELRQEKQQRDRTSREKEMSIAEKYLLEQNLSAVRLELELKEERVVALTQELDELTFGGKTEEEVAHLKKAKHELDKKVKEQEEELDDLAGQVQLLEQAKLRLEMSLEQQRKENRRELAQRDEELEDVRCNAHKKVKALESQLESEHEERTQLLREKHELERRLGALEEQGRAARATDEDQLHRLRRDLRRTKALLRDAQIMLERARGDSPGKALIRQLRNQLEDAEFARSATVKARQGVEMELTEVQAQLEEAQRLRSEAEERAGTAGRERTELRTQLEENEEELAEVLKKYRSAVQQLSTDQLALQEQAGRVAELEGERATLREQLAELGSRLESMETLGDPSSSLAHKRLELRSKELESKLELEQTTRARLEVQITRLKEAVEKLQDEAAAARAREQSAQDVARKLQRSLREAREEHATVAAREADTALKRRDLEKRLEASEAETSAARGDLRLALTRIEDLQSAIQGELEDDLSGSEGDDTESSRLDDLSFRSCGKSDRDSDGSDESINTFLANHKVRANSASRPTRASLDLDIASRSLEASVSKKSTDTSGKESFA